MPCTKCSDGKFKWGETGACEYDSLEDCQAANPDHEYEEMKTTSIVELVISEENEDLAIDCISLVSEPAIEENMVYMSKAKNNLTLAKVDEEQKVLISPALIPDKSIYRYNAEQDEDYYVFFSKETVKNCAYSFLKNNNHHKATLEHQDRVSGVLTVESWIIEDPSVDKSRLYGFNLKKGTWMVKMSIQNEELWQKVKDGSIKGLSIEGYFTSKYEAMQKQEPTDQQILEALNEIIRENQTKHK